MEASALNDELLLFNSAVNKFFVMNASAAFLWDQLKEPAGEDKLAERMCASFSGVGAQQALEDVRKTIRTMVDHGLLIDEGAGTKASLGS